MAKKRYTRAQQLRDPNKRSKLPMSALSPAQQAQRRMHQRRGRLDRNDLYNPARQLSGHRLSDAVGDLVDLEFKPQESAIDRAMGSATQQGTALADRAGSYYQRLAEREAGNVALTQAIGERLAEALNKSGQQVDQAIAGQQQSSLERKGIDEQVRGPGLGGTSEALSELAAMRARAAAESGTAKDAGAQTTANYAGLAAASREARQLRGGEVQQQLLNRLANQQADLRGKREDLGAQRGNAATKHLLDLRQSGFENLVTARGLDIKQSELASDLAQAQADDRLAIQRQREVERNNRANRRLAGQRIDVTARGQDISSSDRAADRRSREQIAADRKDSGGARGKNEPVQSVKYRQNIGSGRGRWRELMRRYKGDEGRVKRIMIEKDKVPPEAYNAIYDLERSGRLHPANVEALEAAGVRVPGAWRRSRSRSRSSRQKGSGARGTGRAS